MFSIDHLNLICSVYINQGIPVKMTKICGPKYN